MTATTSRTVPPLVLALLLFILLLLLATSAASAASSGASEIGANAASAKHHKQHHHKKKHKKNHHKTKHRYNHRAAAAAPAATPTGPCDHPPGEFLVLYDSRESYEAAPQENVVERDPDDFYHHLLFEGIRDEPNTDAQRLMEEDKKTELEDRPGTATVNYNCYRYAQ